MADTFVSTLTLQQQHQQQLQEKQPHLITWNDSSSSLYTDQSFEQTTLPSRGNILSHFAADKVTDGFTERIFIVSVIGFAIFFLVLVLRWIGHKRMQEKSRIYYYSIEGAQLMQTFANH